MFNTKPVTLSTDKVTLRPLTIEDVDAFYQAGAFPELWQWSLPNQCTSRAQATAWLIESQEMVEQGQQVVFAIIDNQSGALVGSTRYCAINPIDRSVEIGFTFITHQYQRTYINTHAKYCLLTHAFESLSAIRVQFKTHENNHTSRRAIVRIGASFEGILRNQKILPDGNFRNSAFFSIISNEWPEVKSLLSKKL